MDATGIQTVDEESCNEFVALYKVTAAGTKITDPGGDRWAMDITLTEQQKADMDSDFSLILYQEVADNDSITYILAHSVTGVGLEKKKHHRPGERNKANQQGHKHMCNKA